MKLKVVLLLLIGAGTVLFTVFGVQPGHLSVDEMAYHLMVRDLWRSGSFAILNGYQDFPSAEFVLPVTVVRGSQLISQYPPLYAFVAAPFYALIGYKGLFLVNSIAFCGSLGLCYLTARRIFDDKNIALNASLIFAGATYAWDYAQAAWPHALTILAVLGSAYLVLRSLQTMERRKAIAWAGAAGLVVGLGVGIRIDTVFVLPALVFVLLFARPARLGSVLALVMGMAPPLALVAAINHERFGIASPFTYGKAASSWSAGSPLGYLPLVALAAAVAAVLWPLTRPAGRAFVAAHRWPVAGIAVLAVGASLAIPEVWALVARIASGFHQLVIDLRVRDLGIREGGLSRGPSGGMVYMTGLKKSLLQSSPYLVALIVPIWAILRGRPHALP
ncbi:MAG TPA: glycosyltransferase family 39 protein, partial [Kiloniellaceae bacterium]|nr:glycosyltransferase family 39 protein [Kiloniellaceae bacterium]